VTSTGAVAAADALEATAGSGSFEQPGKIECRTKIPEGTSADRIRGIDNAAQQRFQLRTVVPDSPL
jgi:hypothetical protein